MADEPLPECRVKAGNTSANSENRIHDDAVARQYGFRGALVPGVTGRTARSPGTSGWGRVGETLATRGRVRSLHEKKGRASVEIDLAIVAEPVARPVARVLHTAVYRLPAPAR